MKKHARLIFIGAAVALLGLEAGSALHRLWHGDAARGNRGNAPIVGRVAASERSLRVRPSGSLSWFQIAPGAELRILDTLVTGPASSAILELHGGSRLFMKSSSLITLAPPAERDQAAAPAVVEVELGEVDVMPGGGPLTVRSEDGEQKFAGKGTATLRAAGATPDLLASKESEPSALIGSALSVLRFKPEIPAPSSSVRVPEKKSPVAMQWSGDEVQFIEISRDVAFKKPERITAKYGTAVATLAPGLYYWRTGTGDSRSESAFFKVVHDPTMPKPVKRAPAVAKKPTAVAAKPPPPPPPPPPAAAPLPAPEASKLTLSASTEGHDRSVQAVTLTDRPGSVSLRVTLQWQPVPGAAIYAIQISQAENFATPFEFTIAEPKSEFLVHLDSTSNYYWRVAAKSDRGDMGQWTQPQFLFSVIASETSEEGPEGGEDKED